MYLTKLCESVSKIPPMFQEKADKVSFASTNSVLNHTPILIDRCAAHLGKLFYQKGIGHMKNLRSHRLWRVLPREFKEGKDLTELLQCLLIVFDVHRF